MSQPEILTLAKQGNPQAIAAILNRAAPFEGVIIKVVRQGNSLHILLESVHPPAMETGKSQISRILEKLELESVITVRLYARQMGEKQAIWNQTLQLTPPPPPEPLDSPGSILESPEESLAPETAMDHQEAEEPDLDRPVFLSDHSEEAFTDREEPEASSPALGASTEIAPPPEPFHPIAIEDPWAESVPEEASDPSSRNLENPPLEQDESLWSRESSLLEDLESISPEEDPTHLDRERSPSELESSPSDLQSSLSELESSLSEVEMSPSELESSPSDLQSSLSELESSLSEVEMSPSELESFPSEVESSPPTLGFPPSDLEGFSLEPELPPEDSHPLPLEDESLAADLDDLSSEPNRLATDPNNMSSDLDDLGIAPHNLSLEPEIPSPSVADLAPDSSTLLSSPSIPMSDSEMPPLESSPILSEDALEPDDALEPGNLTLADSAISSLSVRETLKKPEAIAFLFLIAFITLWEAFILVLEENEPVDISLSGRGLARRLEVNASTISRRRDREDFTAWSQELDPDGTAWVLRADGRFVPAPPALPAVELPQGEP